MVTAMERRSMTTGTCGVSLSIWSWQANRKRLWPSLRGHRTRGSRRSERSWSPWETASQPLRRAEVADATALFQQTVRVLFGGTAAALLFSLLMVSVMTTTIAAPLVDTTVVAERVAAADLTVRVEPEARRDEVGALQRALATMVANLREMNGDLRQGVGVLASSSTEILTTVVPGGRQRLRDPPPP